VDRSRHEPASRVEWVVQAPVRWISPPGLRARACRAVRYGDDQSVRALHSQRPNPECAEGFNQFDNSVFRVQINQIDRESQTDAQRGEGVFGKSLEALKLLNRLSYGVPDSGLILNLVHNPAGAFLPARQEALEAQFRRELSRHHGIVFNRLYTITNMPISRYLDFLIESGNYEAYMERLANAFNPAAAAAVMCRHTISVGWDGTLYDCDFNQMLAMTVDHGAPATLDRLLSSGDLSRRIRTDRHCFGCTAGAGSSCGGSIE